MVCHTVDSSFVVASFLRLNFQKKLRLWRPTLADNHPLKPIVSQPCSFGIKISAASRNTRPSTSTLFVSLFHCNNHGSLVPGLVFIAAKAPAPPAPSQQADCHRPRYPNHRRPFCAGLPAEPTHREIQRGR